MFVYASMGWAIMSLVIFYPNSTPCTAIVNHILLMLCQGKTDHGLVYGQSLNNRPKICYIVGNMADLTREDILKLAQLARLDLTDDEVNEYSAELTEILKYVEQLQSVDVDGLRPTSQVTGLVNVMRKDEQIDYGYKPRKLLKNVPHVEDEQLKVKRMIG